MAIIKIYYLIALIAASRLGDTDEVNYLLKEGKFSVNSTDDEGNIYNSLKKSNERCSK